VKALTAPALVGPELHFGDPQAALAIVFAVLAVALAALFAVIAARTRRDVQFERVQKTGYRIRRRWLVFLALLGVVVVTTSLFFLPYSSGAKPDMVVRVTGGQFYWSMSPQRVPVGTRVRFDVTAADVNHGFGVYDPDGKLLGSVQAMPGFHNELDLDLDKPGEYLISCLEFCGVNHHEMSRRFEVVE
jgi:cytochrome c oxidase subunit 2